MRNGRFDEAWSVSDELQRMRCAAKSCRDEPRHLQHVWDGRTLHGGRVLVRCHHGLGDTIQYVRLLPRLREIASRVILCVQPKLMPLFARLPGVDEMLPLHEREPDVSYDADIELAELMHAFRITLATLPARVRYLSLPARAVRALRRRAGERIVGLVWRSGDWDDRRSIPCEALAPLGEVRGIEWRLFQHGPALAEWKHGFGIPAGSRTLLEEAHAMRELDLLISVDSFPAHLAGALGVPVWTLLHSDADWRWMRDRRDTPWYPSMRLVRQRTPDDWREVIGQVRGQLAALQRRGCHPVSARSARVVSADARSGSANVQ